MDAPEGPAAPESGITDDPDILALLDFEPVPRARDVENAWTPDLQREFISRLAVHGSATKACEEMGKNRTGVTKLYRSPQGESFREAWHAAVELAKSRREAATAFVAPGAMPPTIDNRRKHRRREWNEPVEDPRSTEEQWEEVRDGITMKLLNARRLYLWEICECPGKRAAFEILTAVPVDWEKAASMKQQPDEPWRRPNLLRQPDILLTAEHGWLGELVHGEDKKAELRRMIDEHRAENGKPPIDWTVDDRVEAAKAEKGRASRGANPT